ncbi:polyprenyl synthetase family protein [Solicola sp. PLA-1-18]|uniref:polyprenyl synthetase family protein n=1 Tax=Solicola sp. PLA-1-18 TaxID=3380532 RepID=UPI003B81E253
MTSIADDLDTRFDQTPEPDAPLGERVRTRLVELVDERAQMLLDVSPDLAPVVDAARDLVARGKRVRASFCYWGWRGAGEPDSDVAVRAAASLELFHAAALVHDDLMDRSDTRRGMPSTHLRFADQHRDGAMDGDPVQFGDGAALLVGDLLLSWSDEMLADCGASPAAVRRARRVYAQMRTQVMGGQYLDVLEQARPGVRADASATVLRYKSAKYSVEHPLVLGGALAGAPRELLDGYAAFGLPVGEAFQLRDDLLGVFGDPATTGKPVGDDLREGKKTLLVAIARERAGLQQRAHLDGLLGDPDLDDDGRSVLARVLVDTGAVDEVEARIDALVAEAETHLHALQLPDDAHLVLADLAVTSTRRTA